VALGALAGAGIAGASYFKTAMSAFKLSIGGFIIPYLIVYNPILNLHVKESFWAVGSLVSIPLALIALTACIYNVGLCKLTNSERMLSLLSSVALLGYCTVRNVGGIPVGFPLLGLGLGSFGILLVRQIRKTKSRVAIQASGA
jgi:TRAP-type uncharacterized transport system fused permease subunit